MRDRPDFPKWVPAIVRERARELHAQSLALAAEAGRKAAAAADELQKADAQAKAKTLTGELQAIAKVVLQQPSNPPTLAQRLLALAALVRQQATGGAKAVREAQEAAARNWRLDADNIVRVAGDPDMQGVWKYLGQRRREGPVKTQLYFHPARDDARDSRGKPAQHWREDRFASRAEWKQAQGIPRVGVFYAVSGIACARRSQPSGSRRRCRGRPMKWRSWPAPWKPMRTSDAGRRSLRWLATSWRRCSAGDSTHRRPGSRV